MKMFLNRSHKFDWQQLGELPADLMVPLSSAGQDADQIRVIAAPTAAAKQVAFRRIRTNLRPNMILNPLNLRHLHILLVALSIVMVQLCGGQLLVDQQPQLGLESQQQQQQPATQPVIHRHHEIAVHPNEAVRLQCKLPQIANGSGKFYWNFQRSSPTDNAGNKPDLLCFQAHCFDLQAYGIQLDVDQTNGSYDLLIKNATYEKNDGIYYCDYKDTAPNSRAEINQAIRLIVLMPPQTPTLASASSAPAREGQEFQLSCSTQEGNPEPNISWFRNDQQLVASAQLATRIEQSRSGQTTTSTLTWMPTIDDHRASFRCSVQNRAMAEGERLERELTLQVEYAPRITLGPYNPMRVLQGDRATLSCQVDANPPVKGIRWFADGKLISNQYNHTIHDVRIADANTYTCQADNGIAWPLLAAVQQQLSVGQTQPVSGGGQQQQQQQQQQQPQQTTGSFFSSFLGLSSSAGSSASTAVEARLYLEVLYAPRVQVRHAQSGPHNKDDYLMLNCSSESWPPAYEFVWTKQDETAPGGFRRIQSSGSPQLEFKRLTANDMGNYTCTAFNRLEPSGSQPLVLERQASGSALVQVRHEPGQAELLVGQQGETELGNKTLLHCRVRPAGFPEPQYRIWRFAPGGASTANKIHLSKASNGPTYTIYSAKPEDEAKYGCVAMNELGSSNEAAAELIVNEPPVIIPDQARRNEDARAPGEYPYSITVRASGKPAPRVAWFHRSPVDGRRVELSAAELAHKFRIETVPKPSGGGGVEHATGQRLKYTIVSTLTFKQPLEVDDRGQYSVEFANGLSHVASEEFQLHIFHGPVPAVRHQPVLANERRTKAQTKAGFNIGDTVNLTCRVSAWPTPDFMWHGGPNAADKAIDTNLRYRTTKSNPIDDIWEETLSFELTSESDYGEYMCSSANAHPSGAISESIQILINLAHKSAPDAPTELQQVDATEDSVSIQWIPGFDGGFAQNQFIVQYAPDDSSGVPMSRRYMNHQHEPAPAIAIQEDGLEPQVQAQSQSHQFPKYYDCLSMNPCTINQLAARQSYSMRVRARNERGLSDFSQEIRVVTRANMSHVPKVLDAKFDANRNVLQFRIEPQPEYLLGNLNARIEVRSQQLQQQAAVALDGGQQQQQEQEPASEWRLHSTVPIRQEQSEAYLNVGQELAELRVMLCSRANENLCGPARLIDPRGATSSFLQDQSALSLPGLAWTLAMIVILGAFATSMHSCCLSRKPKKEVDGAANGTAGNTNGISHHHRADSNGSSRAARHHYHQNAALATSDDKLAAGLKSGGQPHGSTTSTNSTSVGATNIQSLDSLSSGANQLQLQQQQQQQHHSLLLNAGGSSSDHSSDHSRQAKLDSMLPPNYSHYADRVSLMLEQQQQQQQQQTYHLQDKLSSPFGVHSNNNNFDPQADQMQQHFGSYAQTMQQMQQQQQQQHDAASLMQMNSMMGNGAADGMLLAPDGLWQTQAANRADDYASYSNQAAASYADQQQLFEATYGSAQDHGALMMAAQSAAYDNSANQSYQQQSYVGQQQQQEPAQYQQEIVAAQQQMYGTLTRAGYSNANQTASGQQQQQQQQQQTDQFGANGLAPAAGLMQPPPPPIESDYGTTGGSRSGRLIREIIV